jgi:hypothetical protein
MSEVERSFGYLAESERPEEIDEYGLSPEIVLTSMRAEYPTFNAYAPPFLNLQYQGMQGACQGHALAHAFQLALVQKYGYQAIFSRGGAYYLSQRFDGIRGDKGSTLAGGQKVADSGLCLESEWPYPSRYDSRQPSTANGKLNFRMPGSKRIKDADLAWELLQAGAAIQTGVAWTNAFEREVSDRYTGAVSAGGHSTLLYGLDEATGNAIHHNSWRNWMGDGRSQWTKSFFAQILKRDRWAVFVAYDSTNLQIPDDAFERIEA